MCLVVVSVQDREGDACNRGCMCDLEQVRYPLRISVSDLQTEGDVSFREPLPPVMLFFKTTI